MVYFQKCSHTCTHVLSGKSPATCIFLNVGGSFKNHFESKMHPYCDETCPGNEQSPDHHRYDVASKEDIATWGQELYERYAGNPDAMAIISKHYNVPGMAAEELTDVEDAEAGPSHSKDLDDFDTPWILPGHFEETTFYSDPMTILVIEEHSRQSNPKDAFGYHAYMCRVLEIPKEWVAKIKAIFPNQIFQRARGKEVSCLEWVSESFAV